MKDGHRDGGPTGGGDRRNAGAANAAKTDKSNDDDSSFHSADGAGNNANTNVPVPSTPIDTTGPTPRRSNVGQDRIESGGSRHSSSRGRSIGIGIGGTDDRRGQRSSSGRLPSPAKRSPIKGGRDRGGSIGRNIAEDYASSPKLPRLGGSGDDGTASSSSASSTGAGAGKAAGKSTVSTPTRHTLQQRGHASKDSSADGDKKDKVKVKAKEERDGKHHHHRHHHKHGEVDAEEEEEDEDEEEKTLRALETYLSTYAPTDQLDDEEVLRLSQKAYNLYRKVVERRRDKLIFGYDEDSSTEGSGTDGENSTTKGLGLLLAEAEVVQDGDPEEAMWKYGSVEERFFDSVVVSAAVNESERRLVAAAAAESADAAAKDSGTGSPQKKKSNEDNDAAATADEVAHSTDEDNGDATDNDVAKPNSNANSIMASPRPNSSNKSSGRTPISVKPRDTPKKAKPAVAGKNEQKAPRVVMDDPTLDEVRKRLGLRESEFVFSSTGRRRKHHYIRPRRHHRHHYDQMHHHGHDADSSNEDNYDGDDNADDAENEGVRRALGSSKTSKPKPKPTRVTRRLTKAHREKKKEERHARQMRGLEALVEEAMDLEVTIQGKTMSTSKALENVNIDTSSEEEEEKESEDESMKEHGYSIDDAASSSDESSIRQSGKSPGSNEEVPLYAMVPAAEYGRVRRRAGRLTAATSDAIDTNQPVYDSDDDIWDGGTAYRPVTVTRVIVNKKPVYLAKLSRQIRDAAYTRRRAQEKVAKRRQDEVDELARAGPSKRHKGPLMPSNLGLLPLIDPNQADEQERLEVMRGNHINEDGAIFPEVITDFRLPQAPGKVFNQPVSLNLLDWKRRQELYASHESHSRRHLLIRDDDADTSFWSVLDCQAELDMFPSAYDKNGKKRPLAAIASALDPAKEMWETVDALPTVERKRLPVTVEPKRRRHADATYASWASQLLNFLGGSGRRMARHEFFYSDIDRAWFNFDSFGSDVSKLGIPETACLSRSEKSLVRRGMKSRSRSRFSRRFITSQMKELNTYRRQVRQIQRGNDTQKKNFAYDVPAPIRVGRTVSALSKRTAIVHRGIVLNKHPGSNGYLIQFERKELGYEFCPDTEIASHGVPNIILPAVDIGLDGSYIGSSSNGMNREAPYGTAYGPLPDAEKSWDYQSLSELQKRPEVMIARPFILKALQKPTSAVLKSGNSGDNMSEMKDKAGEREILIKLMGSLNDMKTRKETLIDALEICHKNWKVSQEDRDAGTNEEARDTFKAHYAWLRANLDLTNKAISKALYYLRTMYGKIYSGSDNTAEAEDETARLQNLESALEDALATPQWRSRIWDNWTKTAVEGSKSVGVEITSAILERDCTERSTTDGIPQERQEFLKSRLSSAAALLQLVKFCEDGASKPIDAGATNKSLHELLHSLQPSYIDNLPSAVSTDLDLAREQSYNDLSRAVALLQAELTQRVIE